MENLKTLLYKTLVIGGSILFFLGLLITYNTFTSIREKSVNVPAKVVALNANGGEGLAPACQYFDEKGHEYVFQSHAYYSPPQYQMDDKIAVHYNPQKPEEAWVSAPMLDWFLPALFSGLGGFIIMVGFGVKNLYVPKLVKTEEEEVGDTLI
jgi:Protein of unknown function (DUF3592)